MEKQKISTIKIRNFKVLKELTIDFADLTILAGTNSSGKSTIIQSLLFLKQNLGVLRNSIIESFLQDKSVDVKGIDESVKNLFVRIQELISQPQVVAFNGEYLNLGTIKDLLHQESYGEEDSIILELIAADHKLSCKVEHSVEENKSNLVAELQGQLTSINLLCDGFSYIHTHRALPQDNYPLLSDLRDNANLGIDGRYVAHFLEHFKHKELSIIALKHKNANTLQLLDNVTCWLGEISEQILIHVATDERKASLAYSYVYGDARSNELRPQNVGFGITYVLPIIVAILRAEPGDLLIVENPETHLHPSAQVAIAHLCALAVSHGVQMIIETHSDHFLNGIRVATKNKILTPKQSTIYFLEKGIEGMEIKQYQLNIDAHGRITQKWPRGFFDEYEKQLDELIQW